METPVATVVNMIRSTSWQVYTWWKARRNQASTFAMSLLFCACNSKRRCLGAASLVPVLLLLGTCLLLLCLPLSSP